MIIFILERDEKIANELKKFLEIYNFDTKIISSVKKLKTEYSNCKPNLIISNPIISNLPPFYFIKCIREEINDQKTPIIIYHEKPTKDLLSLAKTFKISSFLKYPFDKKNLLERIYKLLKLTHKKIENVNILKKNKIIGEINRKIEQLPPFPSVIQEIERMINNKKTNASDFEDVIKKDQVITAKVLKIINSPFFSLSRKISTISESVAYMGFDTLKSVIYSAYASKLLNVNLPAYNYKKNELWKHSYLTACFSKEISKFLHGDIKSQEEIFIGGLLHDIGKLIIGNLAKEKNLYFFKNSDPEIALIEMEKEYFYLNHQEVGKLIAEKWNLPEIHKNIIENHHLTSEINNKNVAIANLANFISKSILNLKITNFDETKKKEALDLLNLKDEDYTDIKLHCEQALNKIQLL